MVHLIYLIFEYLDDITLEEFIKCNPFKMKLQQILLSNNLRHIFNQDYIRQKDKACHVEMTKPSKCPH